MVNCATWSASGLQVIVQLKSASGVQKLYSNQSMDPHTPVTVEVERDGLYQVTVFPITEGRGILDSSTIHTQLVTVTTTNKEAETEVNSNFTTTEVSSTPLLCQPKESQTGGWSVYNIICRPPFSEYSILTGFGSALGVVCLIAVALVGLVVVLLLKIKSLQKEQLEL